MRSHIGVSATVRVDHKDLVEHADPEEDEEDSLVTYIESVPNKNFTVDVQLHHSFLYKHDDVIAKLFMDGRKVAGMVLSSNKRQRDATFQGMRTAERGQSYLQKFCFAELKTTDESAKGSKKEDLKDLGTIEVQFFRGIIVKLTGCNDHHNGVANESQDISEKSLKGRAISNRTDFGAKEKIPPLSYCDFEYPFGREPFAVFKFKYRSRRDLQIEGILERSPSPVPLEDRDPTTLTREELQELLALRNRELEDERRIKREKRERSATVVDGGDDNEVSFKGMSRSKRARTSNDSGIDLIDLTED